MRWWAEFQQRRVENGTIAGYRAKMRPIAARFDRELRQLAKAKGSCSDEYQSLYQQMLFELSEYGDAVEAIETEQLLRIAGRYFITIADIGTPPEPDDSWWKTGNFGDRYIMDEGRQRLEKLIREGKKQTAKDFRERCTFLFSIAIGILGIALTIYNTFLVPSKISSLEERVKIIERQVVPDIRMK